MMFYTVSAMWSRSVYSTCYTKHDQCCGAVLTSRITTIAMSRSGQLTCVALLNQTVAVCSHVLQASR
jgi:hypothetical protein